MKIKVSYQTLQLPPPFAFGYVLDLDLDGSNLRVDFQMEYLNRDSITEEEILSEGYTGNDDFEWSGQLPPIWNEVLSNALKEIKLDPTADEDNAWLHVQIDHGGTIREGLVQNLEEWEYRFQELIQAIYEEVDREAPLKLQLLLIRDKTFAYEFFASFVQRHAKINQRTLSWESMQDLLSVIFSFEMEQSFTKQPNETGFWVDADGTGNFQRCIPNKKLEQTLKDMLESQ